LVSGNSDYKFTFAGEGTTVKYEVPSPGSKVRIVVYNVRGQRVAELLNR
jgi:hypothetical protein